MLLADIAEFDARKLYRPAGYSSMFAYCVGSLHRSEDGRVQAHPRGAGRPAVPGDLRRGGRGPAAL